MAYYDGIVFRVYVKGDGLSVGGGGRYDHLIGRYGADRPAVGFSLAVDRLIQAWPDANSTGGDP